MKTAKQNKTVRFDETGIKIDLGYETDYNADDVKAAFLEAYRLGCAEDLDLINNRWSGHRDMAYLSVFVGPNEDEWRATIDMGHFEDSRIEMLEDEGLAEDEIEEAMEDDRSSYRYESALIAEAWERLVLDVVEGEVSIRKV
jgi:hypothetical protein